MIGFGKGTNIQKGGENDSPQPIFEGGFLTSRFLVPNFFSFFILGVREFDHFSRMKIRAWAC